MKMKSVIVAVALVALTASGLVVGETSASAPAAVAADASQFDPGNIISDSQFFNGSAMSAGEVQNFLVGQVPVCRSSFACLTTYRQDTPTMPASAGRCDTYAGRGNESAADIITRVGIACGISQKAMLVLLEKEQSLVSSSTPGQGRFTSATGMGCPDTAGCDPAVAGFFYQVYYAARQFKIYATSPNSFNHIAGRVNNVRFHPNASCGSSPVYIANQATAGLYNYTPYQPNAAALNNLYGTGDGCSAYGNRNFWRIYSDWFGSPIANTSLLRTAGDATVYLVSGQSKYPVTSLSILASLAPLGQVGYVSQSYLDNFSTGHVVGRSLRGPDGTIYFYDSGIRLPFSSCGQAIDYGASCDPAGYVQLTDVQISTFVGGPVLSSVMGTVEGGRYYIRGGTKAEILDDQSQALAGISSGMNVLTENALADLRLVAPIVRDGAFAATRGTSSYSLLTAGSRYTVVPGSEAGIGATARASGSLLPASMAMIALQPKQFGGVATVSGSGTTSVLAPDGQYRLTSGGLPAGSAIVIPQSLLDSYPAKGTLAPGSFIKSTTDATVYVSMPTDIRPVSGWDALLALTPSGSPTIVTIAQSTIGLLPQGPVALTSRSLVRSPDDATVYLVNGVSNLIPFSSFDFPRAAGFNSFSYTTKERLAAYPISTQLLGYGLSCGTTNYISGGGAVHAVPAALAGLYPFSYVPLDSFTCAQMTVGNPATSFIRSSDGTIYQLVDGKKRPVSSMTRFAEISGGASWTDVTDGFAAAYATGAAA